MYSLHPNSSSRTSCVDFIIAEGTGVKMAIKDANVVAFNTKLLHGNAYEKPYYFVLVSLICFNKVSLALGLPNFNIIFSK
jgi:hypothetical protein